MTKALRSINKLWIRHAWGVLGAAFVVLTFFVSLIVLGQISPPTSSASPKGNDYDKQRDRIDKLESEVADLGKALDKSKGTPDTAAVSTSPTPGVTSEPTAQASGSAASPGSAQVHLYSPAPTEVPGLVTPKPSRTSTPGPTKEPTTPAPSPTPAAPAVRADVGVGVDLGGLVDSLSCGLLGSSQCR